MLADDGRTGEAELANDRRPEQVPGNLVWHAEHGLRHLGRQPGVEQALEHAQRRGRCLLRGLQDYRAARRDRRSQFPPRIAEREVPGRESGDGADGLLRHGRALPSRADQRAAVDPEDLAGVELEQADVHQHFDPRFGEGLALFHRRDAGEFVLSFQHQPRGALEHGRALMRRGVAPVSEPARAVSSARSRSAASARGSAASVSPVAGLTTACARRPPTRYPLAVDHHIQFGIGHRAHLNWAGRSQCGRYESTLCDQITAGILRLADVEFFLMSLKTAGQLSGAATWSAMPPLLLGCILYALRTICVVPGQGRIGYGKA